MNTEHRAYYDHMYTNLYLNVARGSIPNMSMVNKFGRNNHIDANDTEDIWAGGGARAYLESAVAMQVYSTDAKDALSASGAWDVTIQGLGADYVSASETVTLNGSATAATTQTFMRVNRAFIGRVGSPNTDVGSNHGEIRVDPVPSGAAKRQAVIEAGDGQTLIGHYTIPANTTAYFLGGFASISALEGGVTGVKQAILRMWIREENSAWRIQKPIGLRSDGASLTPNLGAAIPTKYKEKTDIKWTAFAEVNDTNVYVEYNLLLVHGIE